MILQYVVSHKFSFTLSKVILLLALYSWNIALSHREAGCAQVVAIDLQALSLSLAACLLPPLKQLNRHKPAAMSTVPTFILLGWMSALGALISVVNMVYLDRQPWFQGGTGQSDLVITHHVPRCLD